VEFKKHFYIIGIDRSKMSSQIFFVQIRQGKREEFPAPGRNNSNLPSSSLSLPFPRLEIAIKLEFWYK
jgi:hypothetical protein